METYREAVMEVGCEVESERGVSQVLSIARDQDYFTLMVFFEVSPSQQRRVLDINIDATNDRIGYMPGFVGAAFLKSLDGERVAEYLQWESEGHLREAMKDSGFSEHISELRKISKDEVSPCEVHYVDAVGHQVGEGTAMISKEAGSFTAITEFAGSPEKQQALLDLIVEDHESSLRGFPGLLSVSVLRSLDGGKVTEYLELQSREVLEALGVRAHQEEVSKLVQSAIRLYEVDHVSVAEARE